MEDDGLAECAALLPTMSVVSPRPSIPPDIPKLAAPDPNPELELDVRLAVPSKPDSVVLVEIEDGGSE